VKLKALALIITVLLFASHLYAKQTEGDITVQTEGYGISESDALLKAKRNAVEEGIGTFLISQTEVKNFELQKDVIITKTTGSVKRYDILEKKKQPDNVFYTKIKAVVSLASIKADLAALKILLESMDKPRMMVVIQEENGNFVENAILDYLNGKGFELVDTAVVAALMFKEGKLIMQAAEGDPSVAAQIGVENGAEYIIAGKAIKSLSDTQYDMKSGQVNITTKVVNCSNAKIIASKSASGAFAHISSDTAMAKAAERAATRLMDRKLFEEIVSSFQDMVNNGITLDVTIKKVANFKVQKKIKRIIGDLSNTVTVNKRSFGGGNLKLSVLYKGNADSFSEAVDGISVNGKNLSITDIVGSSVVIHMEP